MDDQEVVLKVGSGSQTKRVAGAVCWRLREVGYCYMRALKAEAVNVAIKAVAVANQKVAKAELVMAMDPSFAKAEAEEVPALALTIQASTLPRPDCFLDFRVSGADGEDDKTVAKLAGAISGALREGSGARLRCIGAKAVYKATKAVTVSKGHLWANGIQIEAVPSWTTLKADEKETSLIQVEVWGKKTAPIIG